MLTAKRRWRVSELNVLIVRRNLGVSRRCFGTNSNPARTRLTTKTRRERARRSNKLYTCMHFSYRHGSHNNQPLEPNPIQPTNYFQNPFSASKLRVARPSSYPLTCNSPDIIGCTGQPNTILNAVQRGQGKFEANAEVRDPITVGIVPVLPVLYLFLALVAQVPK